MAGKEFIISNIPREAQRVLVPLTLGRILFRQEIDEIVGRYGSRAQRNPDGGSIEVVPPIPKDKLSELGDALVKLAKTLEPDGPEPTYDIRGPIPRPEK